MSATDYEFVQEKKDIYETEEEMNRINKCGKTLTFKEFG